MLKLINEKKVFFTDPKIKITSLEKICDDAEAYHLQSSYMLTESNYFEHNFLQLQKIQDMYLIGINLTRQIALILSTSKQNIQQSTKRRSSNSKPRSKRKQAKKNFNYLNLGSGDKQSKAQPKKDDHQNEVSEVFKKIKQKAIAKGI